MAARRRCAGDMTQADVWEPTRVRVAGGVPVMSGECRVRLAGAAHRSGVAERFGSSTRAHTGHAGRRCRTGGVGGQCDVQADC
jgi:hypothetical protein